MIATPSEPVRIAGTAARFHKRILTPQAVQFLVKLSTMFEPRRRRLLEARRLRQQQIEAGEMPEFPPETAEIRRARWKVEAPPADLTDRRVEIIGPTDRKTIIDALNSGAKVFVADFEDSTSPTWDNILEGHVNLCDAASGAITYTNPEGKYYELCEIPPALMVLPRGWHQVERHFLVDGQPISASLFDFGLFFFHNARALLRNGSAPYFYLPKLESYLEARLWNDVFLAAENDLGISRGTIRATVLIETIPAAFEMDEILWELRDHSAGLNCGRWNYIFSYIKRFRNRPEFILPDRSKVTMTSPFLISYVESLIGTCHRRGAHAMGGMDPHIPIKDDARNGMVLAHFRKDKLREVWAGHDGTWVSHPALVPLAEYVFDTYMAFPNQLERLTASTATAQDLLRTPGGTITAAGLERNLEVGLQYLASWLCGNGCIPIHGLMEDAATAEICRAQLWQWLRHGSVMEDGRTITAALVAGMMDSNVEKFHGHLPERQLVAAARLYEEMVLGSEFPEFLTLGAYDYLA